MQPNNQFRLLHEAVSHQRAGRLTDAIRVYNKILQKTPSNIDCVNALAGLYAQQGELNAAISLFRRAAKLRPNVPDSHYNLAVALSMIGQHIEAIPHYKHALKLNPRHVGARNNYATTLLQGGQAKEAIQQYNELIAVEPHSAGAYNNRGMAQQALKRNRESLDDFDKAIALQPSFAEAYANRGNVLVELRRSDEAIANYQKAIALQPTFAAAYNNLGNIHFHTGSYQQAVAFYDKGLCLDPGDSEARSVRFLAKMHLCDWSNFENEQADFVSYVKSGSATSPFIALTVSSSPEDNLLCASKFSEVRFPPSPEPIWRGRIYSHDRIRIAYVSCDFREHPIAYLMAGLFEHHDRSRFEVTAISFAPDQDTALVRRLRAAFEQFIDVRADSDQAIAELIQRHEIDIAVDLVGYTEGARPNIFAQRVAPIQVNYLGFSGTMGTKYFDYIIADPTVIPIQDFGFYSEKVVWLPDAYLPTDDTRTISTSTPSRRDLGLPEDGFVFCCFNQSYKINPTIFEVWMRLLRKVEGSVLWLREYSEIAARNLRSEAQRRGVAPERVIFAGRLPLAADHLARQRRADLFLDTRPYNAHTTATEALWAGLPVLTCRGSSFAGRVGASINSAVGMPELVTDTLSEYEAMALKIANEPDILSQIKEQLACNRQTHPLFDTTRFTHHLEAAYEQMWQTYRDRRPPTAFAVKKVSSS